MNVVWCGFATLQPHGLSEQPEVGVANLPKVQSSSRLARSWCRHFGVGEKQHKSLCREDWYWVV